jgi:hypothetical protein
VSASAQAPPGFAAFAERVRRERDCGTVTVAFLTLPEGVVAEHAADRIAAANGFATLGPQWRTVDRATASALLERLLTRDLCYKLPLRSATAAAALVEQWLGFTCEPRVFLTNDTTADWAAGLDGEARSFQPISRSTFDTGVIATGPGAATMVWVEEDD